MHCPTWTTTTDLNDLLSSKAILLSSILDTAARFILLKHKADHVTALIKTPLWGVGPHCLLAKLKLSTTEGEQYMGDTAGEGGRGLIMQDLESLG